MRKTGKNCLEFKFQGFSASQFLLLMMVKVSFQVGQMVRLEFSFLNLANSCMSSMTLTTMDALQLPQLQMAKG
jgi:hypothetical protein